MHGAHALESERGCKAVQMTEVRIAFNSVITFSFKTIEGPFGALFMPLLKNLNIFLSLLCYTACIFAGRDLDIN